MKAALQLVLRTTSSASLLNVETWIFFHRINDMRINSLLLGIAVVFSSLSDLKADTILYGSDPLFTNQLITIDTMTGAGSTVGTIGPMTEFGGVYSLAFDPNADMLYGSNIFSDELFLIDTMTGSPTLVVPLDVASVVGMAFDSNSNTLYGFGNRRTP